MMHSPRGLRKTLATACLAMCLFAVAPVATAAADEVAAWNETTIKAIEVNGQNNIVATRTLAMAQAAVHDALNAISRRYDAYYFDGPGDPAASPDAATAAAAHTVLVGVVSAFGTPAQKGAALALVDTAYEASFARVGDGPARNKGVAIGRAAGAVVASLAQPGGNITGISLLIPELSAQRLSLLKEVVPSLSRVTVLWNPDQRDFVLDWQELRAAAGAMGVTLHGLEVRIPAPTVESALAHVITREGAEGLLGLPDRLHYLFPKHMAALAARTHLPGIDGDAVLFSCSRVGLPAHDRLNLLRGFMSPTL